MGRLIHFANDAVSPARGGMTTSAHREAVSHGFAPQGIPRRLKPVL